MFGIKTSTIIRSNVPSFNAVRPLSPPSAIATLNPLLKPYAYRQASVPVVIDDQDATHDPPPCGADALKCGLSAVPAKRHGLPHDRAGSFALRISALPHFCRKSPVCLPSTVYKAGSTTSRHRTADFCSVPAGDAALPPLKRFDPPRSMQAALYSLYHCAFWRRLPASCDSPALTNATVAAPPQPVSSLRIVGPPSSKAADFESACTA